MKTYCNPLPIPHYPRGRWSRPEGKDAKRWGWINDRAVDFREMADPTVIRFEGRWYLFPSPGQAWVSDDLVNWTFTPIEPLDPGYAPTVIQKGGWLYMTACGNQMWRARHPLGPWECLGEIRDENGKPAHWDDPMLFVDHDGAMYCYNGLGKDGIYVVRLCDDDPSRWAAPRIHCFAFDPEHRWERMGESNTRTDQSYVEGAWMLARGGKYYLLYSAPATEQKNYALGCYTSDTPVGPWTYQKRNPILRSNGGLINGTGHGCIVEGPGETLWAVYTTLVRIDHVYERRIGMDPAGFDDEGNFFIAGPTETPQLAPGRSAHPERENDTGWVAVSLDTMPRASSQKEGHEAQYANDNIIRTWWEPTGDPPHWLRYDLLFPYTIRACRTLFADRGLDYEGGIVPAPYRYRIEGSLDGDTWFPLIDRSENTMERHIAYDVCDAPQPARHVRLAVLEVPPGMRLGVWEFTVFADRPA